MNSKSLYDELIKYSRHGRYGFHMPGHKRQVSLLDGMDPYDIDITEIDGFDNLHNANGIIKDAMDNAKRFLKTKETWFLINGSTCGILAAINAVTNIGDSIVIGRNCHKAVYNAIEIRNLNVKYFYPEYIDKYGISGGYSAEKLDEILSKNSDVKAVVITSPTYDGVVSNIKKLADVTHKYNAVLIVDEAHGAHFGLSNLLPMPAYNVGADLVIESAHKTLPALTQTGFLHLGSDRVSRDKIEECLSIYETSSPSYVLMASLDKCIRQLQLTGNDKIEKLLTINRKIRKNVNKLKHIHIPCEELIGHNCVYGYDETRLIISIDKKVGNGKLLTDLLRDKYNFEMEMSSMNYTLAITSICDDEKEINRLCSSLQEIDGLLCTSYNIKNDFLKDDNCNLTKKECSNHYNSLDYHNIIRENNIAKVTVYDARNSVMERVEISKAANRISGEYLYLYPPGCPILVPGEVISEEMIRWIGELSRAEMNICGLRDKDNKYIFVVK